MAVGINSDAEFSAAMRRAEAESGTPSDAELYGSGFAPPESESEPVAEPVEAGPSEPELVRELGLDIDELEAWAAEHPEVQGLFRQPTTDAEVRANAQIVARLMEGEQAAEGLREVEASQALEDAYSALAGDEWETATAADALVGAVDLETLQEFVQSWHEIDPDAASRWAWSTADQVAQAQAEQDAAAAQEQAEQAQQHWQKLTAVVDEFAAEHPDWDPAEVAQLAAEAVATGMDPSSFTDPEKLPGVLATLHEGVRQSDPDVPGSPAWEAAQQAAILNADLRQVLRTKATKQNFIDRLPAGLGWDDVNSRVVVQPTIDEARLTAASRPRLTQAEWEQAERDRIFEPDRERRASFRNEVRKVADAGEPGARRTSRFGSPPRASDGRFASRAAGAQGEDEGAGSPPPAAAAAPATPNREWSARPSLTRATHWDNYPRARGGGGAWWKT